MRRRLTRLLVATIATMALLVADAAPAGAYPTIFASSLKLVEFDQRGDLSAVPMFCGAQQRIFWYGKGSVSDELWTGFIGHLPMMGYSVIPQSVGGDYMPLAGDFNGDSCTDILWYAAGPAPDYVWTFNPSGAHTSTTVNINGTYRPTVGRLNGDSRDDIYWYAPGPTRESIWLGTAVAGALSSVAAPQVNGDYQVRSFLGGGTVLWYAAGPAADYVTSVVPGSTTPAVNITVAINGTYELHSISTAAMLYAPGPTTDYLVAGLAPTASGYELITLPGNINSTFRVGSSPGVPFSVLYSPAGRDYNMTTILPAAP